MTADERVTKVGTKASDHDNCNINAFYVRQI